MQVLILAAGFGTRLYPLTKNIPKALINIKKKPIIEYILNNLEEIKEIENICILSNNKFYINFLEWLNSFKNKKEIAGKIKILNNGINTEKEKKGAIADLKYALNFINGEDLLVLASDNLFDFQLGKLVDFSKNINKSVVALKKLQDKKLIKKYSCVLISEQGKIKFFEEKPKNPKSNICATACYLIKKEDVDKIREHKFEDTDNLGNIVGFLYKESEVYGKIFDEFWYDIGSEEELKKAEANFT